MSSNNERVFVMGASGGIGTGVVRGLVKNGINTTAYVRNEQKAKDLFKDELTTNLLTIVVGDYSSVDVFTKAITGHTRFFILVDASATKPASMSQTVGTFGKIAFEQNVRQIVHLSSLSVSMHGKVGIISYMHSTAEEKLWTLADENPEQRSLVVLRPGGFMTNHLWVDVHSVKYSNKLSSDSPPSSKMTWIDTKDMSDCAVVILSESIEKHDRNVYEMGGETLTNEQRAAVFSKVLNRPITYEQQSIADVYKAITGFGMSHSFAYNITLYFSIEGHDTATPQLAILLNRPLRTFEEWLKENVNAFQ